MTPRSIAWFDGHWGEPQKLQLPLSDRGLQLADGLFETVLVLDGQPRLLEAHLQRWQRSAELLAMAPPPEASALQPLIEEAIRRAELPHGSGALRLNWSRGNSSGRGIELPAPATPHRFWLQLSPHRPSFSPQTAIVFPARVPRCAATRGTRTDFWASLVRSTASTRGRLSPASSPMRMSALTSFGKQEPP